MEAKISPDNLLVDNTKIKAFIDDGIVWLVVSSTIDSTIPTFYCIGLFTATLLVC